MSEQIVDLKYNINPEAKLLGAAILSLSEAQTHDDFVDLEKEYGYDNVDPEAWYDYQEVMDFLKALGSRMNRTQNMVAIGMKVFDVLPLPETIQTVPEALGIFDMMNASSQKDVVGQEDWYQIEVIDENTVKFTDNSPLPHDLVYGEVYSLARRFRPENKGFTVVREYMNEGNPDSQGAAYTITIDV